MASKESLGIFGEFEYYVTFAKDGSKYTSFQLEKSHAKQSSRASTRSDDSTLIVLDSLKSGIGRTENNDFYSIVIAPILEELNWNHNYIKTTSHDSVSQFAQSLDPLQDYEIWIISGDTTISEFCNNLPNKKITRNPLRILPLPMGTGNAWANSLGFDSPITAFRNYLNHNLKPRDIPLYRAALPNGYSIIFFMIFSLGFHANLLHACEDPKYAKMGAERFQIAAQSILESYSLDLDISLDGLRRSYAYFALINTPNLEATYKPSPRSNPLERELRLLGYSSSLGRQELVEKIMQGYQNKPNGDLPTNEDMIYKSITHDFTLVLNDSLEDSSMHKFEICCDGILLNLLDYQSPDKHKPSNEIRFQFLNDYSGFQLQVYSL
ncbi:ZYRO0G06556p [Zygosaccharomyces rouxii]|uniref:ZYRO0G06556p n=1 Tax=Zygosaccharomyces rouxii (strain ATCC 2623 / CBS 732 / NBRC 1130 / NCYC 568 / NRRL Y-229) TaxID=559307 RepID=C5DZR3_ZYGRC|nr:uncharacterized protein ZYRO0G06556g [Zygosaccharomyces rouxii]KAH9202345.1 ATP-NAD kinase-like domain-containing protein [Zygosaccharomyces rouxii]CAR29347.1 ZYRO0G06556p [Zygosaccharomyces rouxii]